MCGVSFSNFDILQDDRRPFPHQSGADCDYCCGNYPERWEGVETIVLILKYLLDKRKGANVVVATDFVGHLTCYAAVGFCFPLFAVMSGRVPLRFTACKFNAVCFLCFTADFLNYCNVDSLWAISSKFYFFYIISWRSKLFVFFINVVMFSFSLYFFPFVMVDFSVCKAKYVGSS